MDLVVTTIANPTTVLHHTAIRVAQKLASVVVERKGYSLEKLRAKYNVQAVLVVSQKGLIVSCPEEEYFFHPGMAALRIKNLLAGNPDHMVAAMQLKPGMSILDCTLGMGTDAIVASFLAGDTGLVYALEASPVIAEITKNGLAEYNFKDLQVTTAARRIKVETADYAQYMNTLADNSFDVVYFDPMFRRPVKTSSGINTLRRFADHTPVTTEIIQAACRIAIQRVVIKESQGSNEIARLGLQQVVGGKYSSICFGIIETGG